MTTFDVQTEPDRVRVQISGELDLQSEPELTAGVDHVLAAGGTGPVVLDLRAVDFIDSCGLRGLLSARERVQQAGRAFTVAVVPGAVTSLLDIAGVGDWFDYE